MENSKLQDQPNDDNNDNEENKVIPLLRYYKVFNVLQCEGVKYPSWNNQDNNPIEQCENVVNGYSDCPEIKPDLSRAYYSPMGDFIGIPPLNQFNSSSEYYSTLFHELTHSTGHKTRLDRDTVTSNNSFGSVDYSKEELIAEMGSSFLCNLTGIDNSEITKNNAGYIQGWLKKLKSDNHLIIQAASKAQISTDYIIGKNHERSMEKSNCLTKTPTK